MNSKFLVSLGFAVIASLAAVPWLLLTAPRLGLADALAIFAVPAVAGYLFVIAPKPARGLAAAVVAVMTASVPWFLTTDSRLHLLAAALILAVLRSTMLYRRKAARAAVMETLLGVGGLILANMVIGGGTVLSVALAIWMYLLTQSLFFLIADTEPRSAAQAGNPFDTARRKALELLAA